MSYHLREAASATDWQQACALLQQVYVQGYTTAERAAAFMTPELTVPIHGVFNKFRLFNRRFALTQSAIGRIYLSSSPTPQ